MTAQDIVLIHQLNAVYARALDGLVPNPAEAWANTFTPEGGVTILDSAGRVLVEAKGTQNLINLWKTFPEPMATRHWFNNIVVEADGDGARMTAYIVAMSIKSSPATIVRTGLYRDSLTRTNGEWRFQERILTLDPASHV